MAGAGQADAAQASLVAGFFVGGDPSDRGVARGAVTDGDGLGGVVVGGGAVLANGVYVG